MPVDTPGGKRVDDVTATEAATKLGQSVQQKSQTPEKILFCSSRHVMEAMMEQVVQYGLIICL